MLVPAGNQKWDSANGKWVYDVEALQAAKKAEMIASFDAQLNKGVDVTINDLTYKAQVGGYDLLEMQKTGLNFLLGFITETDFRDRENIWHESMSQADFNVLLGKLLHYDRVIRKKRADYVDEIASKTSKTALAAMPAWDWAVTTIEGVTVPE